MTGFSAEWLALREPCDAASRAAALAEACARGPAGRGALRVLDLAAGSGSNLRHLAPRLAAAQEWLLLDHDPALLGRVPDRLAAPVPQVRIRTRCTDLAGGLEAADFRRRQLVTASALLDLVSARWIDELAARCARAGAAALFVLSYDGRLGFAPHEPHDDLVRALVNRHQRTDKGFGAALGPEAAAYALARFAALGYEMRTARSDWRLDARHGALQAALIAGWHDAAVEIAPAEAAALAAWRRRRLAHVVAGCSRIVVGHTDIAGRPR